MSLALLQKMKVKSSSSFGFQSLFKLKLSSKSFHKCSIVHSWWRGVQWRLTRTHWYRLTWERFRDLKANQLVNFKLSLKCLENICRQSQLYVYFFCNVIRKYCTAQKLDVIPTTIIPDTRTAFTTHCGQKFHNLFHILPKCWESSIQAFHNCTNITGAEQIM